MVFWIGILVGIVFVGFAVKIGFYEMWAMLFDIIIAVYLGVFLGPIIADLVPAAGKSLYGDTIGMIVTATVSFLILFGISYTFFTGQFTIYFPKVLNILVAGFLGFSAGFLVWSFLSFTVCIIPLDEKHTLNKLGFARQSQKASIAYLSRICSTVDAIVRPSGKKDTHQQTIDGMLNAAEIKAFEIAQRNKPKPPPEPNEPQLTIEEMLGPPPKIEISEI